MGQSALALVSTTSVWGPQLPTPVTQAMPCWDPQPGLVRIQTETQWGHGLEMCLLANVKIDHKIARSASTLASYAGLEEKEACYNMHAHARNTHCTKTSA